MQHRTPASAQLHLAVGRPDVRLAAGESPITDAHSHHPGPTNSARGDGSLMTPNAPHNVVDLGPDTGPMLSTYIVESGGPLAVLSEPSA